MTPLFLPEKLSPDTKIKKSKCHRAISAIGANVELRTAKSSEHEKLLTSPVFNYPLRLRQLFYAESPI